MSALPVGPVATDARLHSLADLYIDGLADARYDPAMLCVSGVDDEDLELGIRPLDGLHPSTFLLGFRAPPDWFAVGCASRGWAYHAAERANPERRRSRAHTVTLVSRSGEVAHRLVVEGRPEIPRDLRAEIPDGEIVDLLRRAIDLPTPPPPVGTEALFAGQWLCEILDTAGRKLRRFGHIARLHPAFTSSRAPDASDLDSPEVVAAVARAHAAVVDWELVRLSAAAGRLDAPELAPDDALWLDDGGFARWVLCRVPPFNLTLDQAARHLRPALADQVREVLQLLGIGPVWPDSLA